MKLFGNGNRIITKKDVEAIQCVDAIARVEENKEKKTGYLYSFSTKFCYWIARDYFPIYDSIANGLLSYYLNIPPTSLGNYQMYVDAYKSFIDKFNLIECPLKDIDVFLWTYGKALSSKDVQNPVAKYISYIPMMNNEFIHQQ